MGGIRRWGSGANGLELRSVDSIWRLTGLEDRVQAVFLQDQSGKKQVTDRSILSVSLYLLLLLLFWLHGMWES